MRVPCLSLSTILPTLCLGGPHSTHTRTGSHEPKSLGCPITAPQNPLFGCVEACVCGERGLSEEVFMNMWQSVHV